MTHKAELIIALDIQTADEIEPILRRLPGEASFFKVGLELFIRDGVKALSVLERHGKKIFLDLKLHDIPRTVAQAVTSACHYNTALLTVHAAGGRAMLTAAAEAAAAAPVRPQLVAVTTLTSLNEADLMDLGITRSVPDQALALGMMALACGIDGVVTSVHEAKVLRQQLGPDAILVTPGIRPAGAAVGDQKRIATPAAAVRAGATYLVVGRPILDAPDPGKAAESILREMGAASLITG